jgi:hypothetical protein
MSALVQLFKSRSSAALVVARAVFWCSHGVPLQRRLRWAVTLALDSEGGSIRLFCAEGCVSAF